MAEKPVCVQPSWAQLTWIFAAVLAAASAWFNLSAKVANVERAVSDVGSVVRGMEYYSKTEVDLQNSRIDSHNIQARLYIYSRLDKLERKHKPRSGSNGESQNVQPYIQPEIYGRETNK